MQNKKYTILLSILNVLKSIFLVSQAYASKMLIEEATKEVVNWDMIFFYAGLFIALVVCLILSFLSFNIVRKNASLSIEVKLKKDLFTTLMKKDINQLKGYHSGEISNVYLNDINNILLGELDTIPAVFLYISRFILATAVIIIVDFRILLILLVLGLFAFGVAMIYGKFMKRVSKDALESDGRLNSYMQEAYENIKIIKALESVDNIVDGLNKELSVNYKIKNKRNNVSLIGATGISSLMYISYAFVLLYGGFQIASRSGFSYGDLLLLTEIVSYFESPLSMFSSLISRYASYKVSKKRIEQLFNLKDDEEQIDLDSFDEIKINNISFSYDQNKIYENFSYEIKNGEKVFIKGPSGTGKSTLFSLLLGFIKPSEGNIIVIKDGKEYPIEKCRNLFSYVSQENILFSGTVRENIELFVGKVEEEKLVEALKTACIYDELMAKENQLDTKLIERGSSLSIGQIQRVLLAICLLKNKPILLLDEFTSALDNDLEQLIIENIAKINSTMLIISHRDIKIDSKILTVGKVYE